jgi:hypothetical protein
MMNHRLLLIAPATMTRRGRLAAATAVVAVLAVAMTVLPAPAASAAPGVYNIPGYLNPDFRQTGYPVNTDCTATVGGWRNDYLRPGVGWQVSCSTPHSNISVWATLWMSTVPGSYGSPYLTTGRWVDRYNTRSIGPAGLITWECPPGYNYWTVQLFVAVDGWTARSIDYYINGIRYRDGSLFARGKTYWKAC